CRSAASLATPTREPTRCSNNGRRRGRSSNGLATKTFSASSSAELAIRRFRSQSWSTLPPSPAGGRAEYVHSPRLAVGLHQAKAESRPPPRRAHGGASSIGQGGLGHSRGPQSKPFDENSLRVARLAIKCDPFLRG